MPLGTAFVARYHETNCGLRYNEGALLVDATYKGERGVYCLAMPVDDDTAMISGREIFGYPKKMADRITLERSGDHVVGSVVRRETEILRIEGDLTRAWVPTETTRWRDGEDLEAKPCLVSTSWLFKHTPAADSRTFETMPRLVREPVLFRPRPGQMSGDLDLKLVSSATDPLGDIPVLEMVEAHYGFFDNTMLPGKVVRKVRNLFNFVPRRCSRPTSTRSCWSRTRRHGLHSSACGGGCDATEPRRTRSHSSAPSAAGAARSGAHVVTRTGVVGHDRADGLRADACRPRRPPSRPRARCAGAVRVPGRGRPR